MDPVYFDYFIFILIPSVVLFELLRLTLKKKQLKNKQKQNKKTYETPFSLPVPIFQ